MKLKAQAFVIIGSRSPFRFQMTVTKTSPSNSISSEQWIELNSVQASRLSRFSPYISGVKAHIHT